MIAEKKPEPPVPGLARPNLWLYQLKRKPSGTFASENVTILTSCIAIDTLDGHDPLRIVKCNTAGENLHGQIY